MNVKTAESAGFCFGVKRAIETVYSEVNKGGKIYTFGPVIHNEEVVRDLENKGVNVINSLNEIDGIKDGTIIVRSHGVGKDVCDYILSRGLNLVDTTCPFVKKIHNIVARESEAGKQVIVIGNRQHPEVQGIIGWCSESMPAIVIENEKEAEDFTLSESKSICIVSQTTFNLQKFQELVEIFTKKMYDINVVKTICNATEERQREARELALESDAVIVIGGANSSNTQKLYEICRRECENTQYIQTLNDLDETLFFEVEKVGITAGASTPNNIIEEVQNYVRINF